MRLKIHTRRWVVYEQGGTAPRTFRRRREMERYAAERRHAGARVMTAREAR